MMPDDARPRLIPSIVVMAVTVVSGVPVVSLPSEKMATRVSASLSAALSCSAGTVSSTQVQTAGYNAPFTAALRQRAHLTVGFHAPTPLTEIVLKHPDRPPPIHQAYEDLVVRLADQDNTTELDELQR